MDYLLFLSLIASFVFAISATISAIKKRLDILGVCFVSFLTATGGGTIRDVLLGHYPITWISHHEYPIVISAGILLTFILKSKINKFSKSFFIFDALGLGASTVIGMQKGMDAGIGPIMAILFGVISANFGSVVRDILCNEVPYLFRKELYATASIAGGIFFVILLVIGVNQYTATFLSFASIVIIRLVAIRYKWKLPVYTIN